MEEEIPKETKTKKLFKWEGIKKEGIWIAIFLMMFLLAWAYNAETKDVRVIIKTDCYQTCLFDKAVKDIQLRYPGLMMDCNRTTNTCIYSGVPSLQENSFYDEMKELNISFLEDDTNNSRTDTLPY